MKILELFSGTEHLSNAFRARGHEAFTVDWNKKFPSSLHIDIETLTADMVLEQFGHPDVIWLGTDCTTYSVAAIGHHRKYNKEDGNLDPQTPYAEKCDRMNQHCLRLIAELKPKVFIIENPRAGLRSMVWMRGIPRYTTTYCQYGFKYMKPTDFWSNVDLRLAPPCKNGSPCHESAPRGTKQGLQGIQGKELRSIYPPRLIEHFVDICEEYVNDGLEHPLPSVMTTPQRPRYKQYTLTFPE